ncbi:MAG: tRNA (adenosine(37)-N6)-threonylcarbamoyltransferase complex ATPase subunit type 1 TsaE, partial [Patescibacteria group bacterium]
PLHGDLGAGKTTFTQQLAAVLGVSETVTSPTFVVMKHYNTEHEQISQLTHIDAYRIEDVDEMRVLRFPELLSEKGTIMCIEWAERIEPLLPATTIHLTFTIGDNDQRLITRHGGEAS